MAEASPIDEGAQISPFVVRLKRRRVRELLRSARGRRKFVGLLPHYSDFDYRFVQPIAPADQSSERVVQALRRKGAGPTCYVISTNPTLDRTQLPLEEAIFAVNGYEPGTFISCLPGRLAFFEGEEYGNRFFLVRS